MNASNKRNKALIVLTFVLFAWGVDFVSVEYMMNYVSATLFAFIRILVILMVLVPIVLKNQGRIHIDRADLPRVFAAGLLASALYSTCEATGIGLTSASFASLILATVPIFGMFADRIIYGKKITGVKTVCIAASIAGVYLLVIGDPLNSNVMGLVVMIVTAIIFTLQIVVTKPLYEKYDIATILLGMFFFGLIVQTPLMLIGDHTLNITPIGVAVTIGSALFAYLAGEFGYLYAIGNLSVTTVAAFENVLPVVTIILSFILYGTMLEPLQIAGGVLILIAVMVIAFKEE